MPVISKHSKSENAERPLSLQALREKKFVFRSMLPLDLRCCNKRQIREYFENTYDFDEYLFSGLVDEQYIYKCPDRLRLPLIFYLAHTATLYVNKLILAGLIDKRVNRHFEALFETGVDEMSWDDTENYRMGGSYKWPSVAEVMEYRHGVRKMVHAFLDQAPLELPILPDHPWWSLFMGMEHERIHIETSSVLLRQLPVEFLKRPENWKYAPLSMDDPAGPNEFVRVPSGMVTLGKHRNFPSYGWDNEYGQVDIHVPEFEATKYLVTNRDFLEFVKEDGYQRQDLWTEEGWKWVKFRQASHPTFWVCDEGCKSGCGGDLASYSHCNLTREAQNGKAGDNGAAEQNGSEERKLEHKFKYRAMFDVLEMPWDWPVDVNYHEAKAFCAWKGPDYRLPTEAEHHRMRGNVPPSEDPRCDPVYDEDRPANISLKFGSSSPVNMYPANSMGFHDVDGNVWEWCEDHFNGLPGYKSDYLYDDFSSPCFDGRHTMMMGGSFISTGDEASRFARYAFRRHFFQHLGFRMVCSVNSSQDSTPIRLCKVEVFVLGAGVTDNPIITPGVDPSQAFVNSTNVQLQYDTKEAVDDIMERQFGQVDSYTHPLLKLVEAAVQKYNGAKGRVINFNCGPGLFSFLLTKTFQQVVAVDYGGRFIDAGIQLQEGVTVEYGSGKVAKVPEEEGVDASKVVFKQMTWIPNEIEGFDLVLFQSLDRLMEPKGWLRKLWECVSSKGLVVLVGSHKWSGKLGQQYIGRWFNLLEETPVGDETVTVWQLRV